MSSWCIFNVRRKVWWRDRSAGYSESVFAAGNYTPEQALAIARRMNGGSDDAVILVPAEEKTRFAEELAFGALGRALSRRNELELGPEPIGRGPAP